MCYYFQGGSPSPFDRIQGTRQATLAVSWLTEKIEQNKCVEGKLKIERTYRGLFFLIYYGEIELTYSLFGERGGGVGEELFQTSARAID